MKLFYKNISTRVGNTLIAHGRHTDTKKSPAKPAGGTEPEKIGTDAYTDTTRITDTTYTITGLTGDTDYDVQVVVQTNDSSVTAASDVKKIKTEDLKAAPGAPTASGNFSVSVINS